MNSSTIKGDLETLVIGGGQAGLAIGHGLASRGVPFLIVDANTEVGAVWRSRWDSLRLFTSSQYNSLPGMPFPGTPGAYPGKDEVADFLHAYARQFDLPVQPDTEITSLARENGVYVARSDGEEIRARQVVVATGPFQDPFIPPIADQLDPQLPRFTAPITAIPKTLPEVGHWLSAPPTPASRSPWSSRKSRPVDIAVGETLKTLRQRPLGRDIWWWLIADATASDHDRVAARQADVPARRRHRRRPERARAQRRDDPRARRQRGGQTITLRRRLERQL